MLSVLDALALNMEAGFFCEILVNCYYKAQSHRLEDSAPQNHRPDNTTPSSLLRKSPLI